jgi:hypothetical protein
VFDKTEKETMAESLSLGILMKTTCELNPEMDFPN